MHTSTQAHRRHCTQRVATETHNICTNMHTHTYTHVYTCIHVHIHVHMHIYTHIPVCTNTYIHIYTHTHTTCTYAHTQTRLERRRGSDCARSPTCSLPISLSAAIRKGVMFRGQQPNRSFSRNNGYANQPQLITPSRQCATQTTPAHLYWCGTNSPVPWLLQPRATEINSHSCRFPAVFLPFSRRFLLVAPYKYGPLLQNIVSFLGLFCKGNLQF